MGHWFPPWYPLKQSRSSPRPLAHNTGSVFCGTGVFLLLLNALPAIWGMFHWFFTSGSGVNLLAARWPVGLPRVLTDPGFFLNAVSRGHSFWNLSFLSSLPPWQLLSVFLIPFFHLYWHIALPELFILSSLCWVRGLQIWRWGTGKAEALRTGWGLGRAPRVNQTLWIRSLIHPALPAHVPLFVLGA